ncbi:hypothetical protein BJ742DRAFT_775264 [Cladochytrium replicatum]|nr:hypothetical protein BJ742DRAFT_775264 [Cladochytrium replicatum]
MVKSVVLDWLKEHGLDLEGTSLYLHSVRTPFSLDEASEKDCTPQVIEWWNNNIVEMAAWTLFALDKASVHGHVGNLEWWKNSGLELKWTTISMDYAASGLELSGGTIEFLEWWNASGLELCYSNNAIDSTGDMIFGDPVSVLDWWVASSLDLRWSERATDSASHLGLVDVLDWWKSSGLELKYSEKAMYSASVEGYIEVLEWWRASLGVAIH